MKRILIPIIACCTMVLILHTDTSKSQDENRYESVYGNSFNLYLSSLCLPDKLDLCGEEIPLDIPEVRERAEREFYLLMQSPGQVILYLKRAGRLFPMYEKLLAEAGLPDDLKYLSVAESALFQSQSHKGAVGLWQFMPGTGKSMGLVINKNIDERRHPEKSTRAAIKFLKQGYKTTNSWILTLGGYNMGYSGIKKRIKHQSGDDYFDLYLNTETSRFIFRIAIIKELMANSSKYGFVIPSDQKYQPFKTQTIKVTDSINSLADWAVAQGTNYKFVRLYNPWILGNSLPAPKANVPWEILIPAK